MSHEKNILLILLSFISFISFGQDTNISYSNFILLPNNTKAEIELVSSKNQRGLNYETQILNIRGYNLLLINMLDSGLTDTNIDFNIK